ncbi:Zn-dependent protease with chaperone function [Pelomonas saccharophila]|uniref:Zn-dependent protease with chaperone function n=1 Tax=Roseateles saccharophilus TaxID=304 RepID=A0ABU1YT76_ROSSA|nr:M48 family metalloprotease [Roseateles saccharophilus]MDR7272047.1 Zn-dependent protease with chaperone function [Roseateles saccharophilus]
MDQADFVHMVRMSEQASAHDSRAYRRGVAMFAALGYLWVLGCLSLALALVAWLVPQLIHGRVRIGLLWGLVAALGLLWASLRALWVRFDAPEGLAITAREAPALFDALERIRKKIHGPPIHTVYLDGEFNASIRQTPRWGLLGGAVNTLTLGLPLLMALDKPRLLAVLTHEYGHLRGDHGRFAAWIYRTRLSWLRLHDSMRNDESVAAAATQAFLNWYFPRFAAKTFALARQDEYEADRIAGRLLGPEVASAALIEIEIKSAWLQQDFWAGHWRHAATQALPVGPFQAMQAQLGLAPEPGFAREALRHALARLSDVADTHPSLRDRVATLGGQAVLPDWSRRGAVSLLGEGGPRWIEHFDNQWCRDNAAAWKQHHAWLARVRDRVQALAASRATSNANELVEEASLRRQLDPRAEVRSLYELALQRSSEHAAALQGLARTLAEEDRATRLQVLQRLWDAGRDRRWWAACAAVQELETSRPGQAHDAVALKLWRERIKQAEEAEERAWEDLRQEPYFSQVTRHDLSACELGEVQAELARCQPVVRAWLVSKTLREFPNRRAYLVFVELPGMADEDRFELCRWLERNLSLPGAVLVLWAGESPTLEEIRRGAFEAVYPAQGA